MKTAKVKRHATYTEKYKKDMFIADSGTKLRLIEFLRDNKIFTTILEASVYSDDTESFTIKIDKIPRK